jgi:hypothetical protein
VLVLLAQTNSLLKVCEGKRVEIGFVGVDWSCLAREHSDELVFASQGLCSMEQLTAFCEEYKLRSLYSFIHPFVTSSLFGPNTPVISMIVSVLHGSVISSAQ